MMSPETIDAIQRENAKEAKAEGKTPLIIEAHDLGTIQVFANAVKHTPFLGDYVPEGYKYVEALEQIIPDKRYAIFQGHLLFVDSSGCSDEGEAALVMTQLFDLCKKFFVARKQEPFYLGIWNTGQFQLHLAVFEKENGDGDQTYDDR